jgi:4-guanidinobutyraldehyde dehydrogenase/NAD-dependent aldehyde dehydrogenase
MTKTMNRADWSARAGELVLETRPFIDGTFVESQSEGCFDKINPADGSVLARFAPGSARDVDAAVAAARAAFERGVWAQCPLAQRKALLYRLADLIERDREEIALLESLEIGKPIRDTLAIDLTLATGVMRQTIEAADRVYGATFPTDGGSLAMSVRGPRGVVAGIVGWNFPFCLAIQKIAPALVTGNSVVIKPSELSALSVLKLAALTREAGIPDGVFNVVPGLGATVGDAIGHHMDIDMLSFTGSTATGKRLLQASGASNMKRLMLECGGKSPNIVLADAPDLERVADGVFFRMFWNSGQVCTAGSRLIVHKDLKAPLLALIEARIQALKPGHPLDPETSFGPLASGPQRDKVVNYIRSGIADGASVHRGGGTLLPESGGFYVEPTIFCDVDPAIAIAQEEIFGPVLAVMDFETVDEAVALANRTIYGLSATVWTTGLANAHRMVRDLKVGEMVIHATGTPTPGAFFGSMPLEPQRQSGVGVESGMDGIAAYTALKSVQMFV